jgi:hypothetical protein
MIESAVEDERSNDGKRGVGVGGGRSGRGEGMVNQNDAPSETERRRPECLQPLQPSDFRLPCMMTEETRREAVVGWRVWHSATLARATLAESLRFAGAQDCGRRQGAERKGMEQPFAAQWKILRSPSKLPNTMVPR